MRKMFFTVFALFSTLTLSAQVFIGEFKAIEKGDTLLVGVFNRADSVRYNALMTEWNEMLSKEEQTRALQRNNDNAENYTSSAADKKLAEIEQQHAAALKQIDKMSGMLPDTEIVKLKKDINEQFSRMKKDIPSGYADTRRQLEEQKAKMTGYDSSEFSNEKKYALKHRFAALAVDGKLHGYTRVRSFRHGRAAVCREEYKPENGMTLQYWGFIDESVREVVPCIYYRVCDFYNITHNASVFVSREDADTRGWTTVWKSTGNGLVQGMVDKDGKMKIPCKFAVLEEGEQYQRIIFNQTAQGEFAAVCDYETNKYGIIDRQGNYTMQSAEKHTIYWYTDIQCFGYRTDDGKLVTFDAYGRSVKK